MVGFPLLLIPLAIYNIVAWLMPGVPLTDPLFRLMLPSGVEWQITLSEILLALGVLLLLLEIVKGARPGAKYLTDHLLSFIVFAGAVAEFVLWPKFGTSTFFLLSLMAMVDFFGGIALSVRRPAGTSVSQRSSRQAEPSRAEPAPAAPASSSTASGAGSARQDHPAPKTPSDITESSPAIPSPELRPGAGSSASPDTPLR